MYPSVSYQNYYGIKMDQSDIQYILELLNDSILERDWDKVEEAREILIEFLDKDEFFEEV